MKKLYRKTAVHSTPSAVYDHVLTFLPAAMLALAVGLSPADREVLAYLVSCSPVSSGGGQRLPDHPSSFNCNCFRCYMSYWAKWDSSSNSLLIHDIIDAYEESVSKRDKGKKERRRRKCVREAGIVPLDVEISNENDSLEANRETSGLEAGVAEREEDKVPGEGESENGPVRKFVSFLGARIWDGLWG